MTLHFRYILLICFFFGITAGAKAQAVHKYTLKNGVTVLVKEDHRSPVVVNMVWYQIGSIDEVNGTTGLSHIVEHMMFKGTKKHPEGEFSRIVASLGGSENAFTTSDFTAYYQLVEKSHLATVMALEADRMQNLQFQQNAFEKEMQVIKEERRMRVEDDTSGVLNELVNATAFMANPYHHPVIGWMEDLEHMQLSDVKNWYQRWYAPNNAVIVIVGDVNPKEVQTLAKRYFEQIPVKKITPTRLQAEPAQRGIRRVEVKANTTSPSIVLAYKAPTFSDLEDQTDIYALSMLAAVLDGYANARLTANLVKKEQIVSSAWASYSGLSRGPALFSIGAVSMPNVDNAVVEQRLREEIQKIARSGVTEQELELVKRQVKASQIYKKDSVFGQAMELGGYAVRGVTPQIADMILEKFQQVTAEQVKVVADKYFNDDVLTIGVAVPDKTVTPSEQTTPESKAALQ